MIVIERFNIKDVPTLQVVRESSIDKQLPTVIYYHGFNGEKESSLTIAYKMAEKGIRVILPDAPLHGERAISEDPVDHGRTFWHIVLQTLDELASIRTYLQKKSYVLDGKIGLGGTSMGGMITYAALRKYDWIETAAILMGTPYLTERAKDTIESISEKDTELLTKVEQIDITKNIDALQKRPLFIWHGELDQIVPVEDSRKFYDTLTNYYKRDNDLQFIEEKERIHNISKLSIKKTAEWFAKQL